MENEVTKFEHLMVDIETMAKGSYAAILSIAAVEFDIYTGATGNAFYVNVDLQSCLSAGLKTDPETEQWWCEQSNEALEALSEHNEPLLLALQMFKKFIGKNTYQIWGNSARFDLGILENAFDVLGIVKPWEYYNERCVRTLVSFAPEIKQQMPFTGTKHNAIDDCLHEIKYCTAIWNIIKSGNHPII